MKVTGKITKVMPIVTGTSKAGKEYRKQSYVLTYDTLNQQYPKAIAFDLFGDKIEAMGLKENVDYEMDIDFSVQEYNGRVFMSASAWKVTPLAQAQAQAQVQAPVGGDLPF